MNHVATVTALVILAPYVLHAQQTGIETEQAVAKVLQNDTVLQFTKQMLAHPKAEPDELLHLITNKLLRPEIDIVPSKVDSRTVRDMRHVVRTVQLSEFGCTLSLPWGMPTRYTVSTNAAGISFLLMHAKPGVAVTLWDPASPSETDLFFEQDIPSAALRLGLDERTLASPLSLWSRALHISSRDIHPTNSVPRLAETASLLIYKACVWPFKTDTLHEFHNGDTTVFQIGSPEKDRKVMLEFFSAGNHATVYVQSLNDTVQITQRDVMDMIEGFKMTNEDRSNKSTVPRKARERASRVR